MSEANKAVVRRWMEEGFNKNDLSIADETFAENQVFHFSAEEVRGIDAFKELVTAYKRAFPDSSITVDEQVAEGDSVATRFTFRGRHTGELNGVAPSGKAINVGALAISHVREGKTVETWQNFDEVTMLKQIGAMPDAS